MEPDTHIRFPSIGSVAEAEINKIKEADLKKIKGDKFTHLQWDLLTTVLFQALLQFIIWGKQLMV